VLADLVTQEILDSSDGHRIVGSDRQTRSRWQVLQLVADFACSSFMVVVPGGSLHRHRRCELSLRERLATWLRCERIAFTSASSLESFAFTSTTPPSASNRKVMACYVVRKAHHLVAMFQPSGVMMARLVTVVHRAVPHLIRFESVLRLERNPETATNGNQRDCDSCLQLFHTSIWIMDLA